MAVLTDAGVVDTGSALAIAAGCGREASVKYLLQHKRGASVKRAYVNFRDPKGQTPLICCIGLSSLMVFCSPSSRIVRLLVHAGANTSSKARLEDREGNVVFNDTLVALATRGLREKKVGGKDATEDQLNRLEGVRRLLLRVEAVHAASWLWPSRAPLIARGRKGKGRANATLLNIAGMLPKVFIKTLTGNYSRRVTRSSSFTPRSKSSTRFVFKSSTPWQFERLCF